MLGALPEPLLARTHAFCLRCVADSLDRVRELCPVSAGFEAAVKILRDVSFINFSGLVMEVGIRQAEGPPLAFFQRPPWMRSWFQGYADQVVELSRRLNTMLAPERVLA